MTPRREKCACRGWLEADESRPPDVERAVRDHNDTGKHQEWLAWHDESLAPVRVLAAPPMSEYSMLPPLRLEPRLSKVA